MLSVENMGKYLDGFRIEDISFYFPKGYIMGIIGENGAGKTTLIKTICGFYKANVGSIKIAGHEINDNEKDAKQRIGTVLQDELFDKKASLMTNADMYGEYYRDYSRELFCEYARRFNLYEDKGLKRKYGKVSRGERMKFELAFALSHKPKLLIMDEPTANFDMNFREEFIKAIMEFISDGEHSVVMATHMMENVDKFVDYVMYIEKGRQLIYGDIESISKTYRMVAGEEYKIKLLGDSVIHMEKSEFGNKALIKNDKRNVDESLRVWQPSMEEIMYYVSKRENRNKNIII